MMLAASPFVSRAILVSTLLGSPRMACSTLTRFSHLFRMSAFWFVVALSFLHLADRRSLEAGDVRQVVLSGHERIDPNASGPLTILLTA